MEETYDTFPISDYKILASLKIRALMNVKEIAATDYLYYRNRLNSDDISAIEAVKEIDKLEKKLVNPFCDAYVKDFLKIFDENPQHRKGLISRVARYYRLIDKSIEKHGNALLLKNNIDLTQEYAKKISKSQNKTSIIIANTANINPDALHILEGSKIYFIHRGKYFMDLPRLEHSFSASELIATIGEIQKMEQDINPEWSDTTKALYIAHNIAQNSSYAEDKKFEKNVFTEKKGNCEAFSCCYEEMMERQNIPCRVCETNDGGHVFNEIYVSKKWVPVDVTWMAVYFSENHTDKEKEELENVEFAGENFVNWHAKEYRYHHISDRAYSMHNDGSINFLSAEELNAARKEIIENPKRNNTPKSQTKESVKEI